MVMKKYFGPMSLQRRVTLVVLALLIACGSVVFLQVQGKLHHTVMSNLETATAAAADARAARLQLGINRLRTDAQFLSNTPPTRAIIRATNADGLDPHEGDHADVWKQRLQTIFTAFLLANPDYSQIRYIGVANDGLELVRVGRDGGQVIPTRGPKLQDKGRRDYFRATAELAAGETYLSRITLNREHGQIQVPHIQTIRASAPVFAPDGTLFGMVVLNMDIGPHLEHLTRPPQAGTFGWLANQEGDFLAHPDSAKTYGFDQGQQHRWQSDYPGLRFDDLVYDSRLPEQQTATKANIGLQTLSTPSGVFHMAARRVNIDPDRPNRHLSLAFGFPNTEVSRRITPQRNALLGGFFVTILVVASGLVSMLNRMFEPLAQVTAGAKAMADGQHQLPSPASHTGEIADLVTAFHHMSGRIQQREREVLQLNDELKRSEAHANQIIDNAPDAMVVTNRAGVIVRLNDRATQLFGYRQKDLLGESVDTLVPPRFVGNHEAHREHFHAGKAQKTHRELYALHADGTEIPVQISLAQMHGPSGIRTIASISDITKRREAEQELRIAATAFDSYEAMFVTDAQANIIRINKAFTTVTGYEPEDVLGQNPRMFKSGRHDAEFYDDMWRCLTETGRWQGEVWDRRKNGEIFPKWSTISSITDRDDNITHYIAIFSDISVVKKAEERATKLAFFDPLTKLPNRRRLVERLGEWIIESERSRQYGAVFFIDLDHFKRVNDTLGHDHGDEVLIEVARRLKNAQRKSDMIARLGGDEFVVVARELGTSTAITMSNARRIGQKLLVALAAPHVRNGRSYACTGSVGVALFMGEGTTAEGLFRNSDVAMYEAKRIGRNDIRFFDPAMQAVLEQKTHLETDLREALQHGQFVLHYQKRVDRQGKTVGAEALVRWNHPQRGLLTPAEFIPACEESGLIVALGNWVTNEACKKLAEWQTNETLQPLKLSINVSAKELAQKAFVKQVSTTMNAWAIQPNRLELEITEGTAHDNLEELIERLQRLRALGVSIALDDFGTGYSSLSYLKRLPLDVLKIDRSFVSDMGAGSSDEAIVQSIIQVGTTLGLEVLAEGVETESQYEALKTHGCIEFQGFHFARPVPAEEFEKSHV
jgi:diguanylate cyclase (GGDEF)-like protein/PAS domain S-box-containing protein